MIASPRHWLDVILWPLLRIFWEPFSRKRSHWWHWQPYVVRVEHSILVLKSYAAKEGHSWWGNFFQRNFGWKTVAILHLEAPRHAQQFQLGFFPVGQPSKAQICNLILSDDTAVLIGDEEVCFFAVSYPDFRPLPLAPDYEITSKAKLPRYINLI